MAIDYCRPQQP